jgi:hypothetical protein
VLVHHETDQSKDVRRVRVFLQEAKASHCGTLP